MLFLVGLGFLVTLMSINVFVFDWLVRKQETFLLVNSYCLRSKVELVCDFKSLRRNVIMHFLFPAAVIVLVPVH